MLPDPYRFIRPVLFSMDPEAAHDFTLSWLTRMQGSRILRCAAGLGQAPKMPRSLMGLTVLNPVGLAAGLDKNGAHIDALAQLGFGFIEVGTVTPRPQHGNPRPRLYRLPAAHALINRMGFNNEGLDVFVRHVEQSRWRADGGILGLNIGKNADTPIDQAMDDYRAGLAAVYPHADYVTVNISSPNTQNLRDLQNQAALDSLLAALRAQADALADQYGRRVPLAVKIAPDLTPEEIDHIAQAITDHTIDGVIATNTTVSRAAVTGMAHADEAGGLSGAPVHELSLKVISRLRTRLGPDVAIIGVGGILSGMQAREKIEAGADAVQLYTGLIYKGPRLVAECVRALQ